MVDWWWLLVVFFGSGVLFSEIADTRNVKPNTDPDDITVLKIENKILRNMLADKNKECE